MIGQTNHNAGLTKARADQLYFVKASGSISSGYLAAGAINGVNLASGAVVRGIVAGSNVTVTFDGNGSATIDATISGTVAVSSLTVASGLSLNSGTIYNGSNPAVIGISSGAIVSNLISDNAITSGKIGIGQIGNSHISSGSIANDKILNNYVTINGAQVALGGSYTISNLNFGNGLTSGYYNGSGSLTIEVATGGITTNMLASGSITLEKFASGLYFVQSGQISSGYISANAVLSGNIGSGQIGGMHIASGIIKPGTNVSITVDANNNYEISATGGASLTSGSVTSGLIGNNAVLSGSIGSGQINYVHLASGFVYTADLTVSLSSGKTFGRYLNGQTIPASGKTPLDVISLAIAEPITPTATLTSSTTIQFNQTAISNVVNFTHTINTLGATISTAVLEWRRNNSGAWTTLSTSTTTPSSYTHTLTDTNFNTQPFNYRYVVTDSAGASVTKTLDITPASYSAPSLNLAVLANSFSSPETNVKREIGNYNTNLSGTIVRNSANVNLQTYKLQFLLSGQWTDIGSSINISGQSNVSISTTNHNDSVLSTASGTAYRISYTDVYSSGNSSQTNVNFLNFIWYGPVSSVPTTSTDVRSISNKIFTDGANPITLDTGTTNKNFSVAMPSNKTITSVYDVTALNTDITASYINNPFNVNNAGGVPTSYNVYTMSNAVPYSPKHDHSITRA
jgi:hypothetical protein